MIARRLPLGVVLFAVAMVGAADQVVLHVITDLPFSPETLDPHFDDGHTWYFRYGHYPDQKVAAFDLERLTYRDLRQVRSVRGWYQGRAIVNRVDDPGLFLFDFESESFQPLPHRLDPIPHGLVVHYQEDVFYGARILADDTIVLARYARGMTALPFDKLWAYPTDVSDDRNNMLLLNEGGGMLFDLHRARVVRRFAYEGVSTTNMLRFLTNDIFYSPPRLGNSWYLWHIDGRMLARVEFFFRSPYHNAVTIIFTEDLTHAIVEFANRGKLGNLRERGTLLLDSTNFRDYLLERGWLFEPREGVLNASRVRMRENPNLQATHLRFLEKGERVEVLDRSGLRMQIGEMNTYWYKVRTADGEEGWSYGAFIDLGEKLDR